MAWVTSGDVLERWAGSGKPTDPSVVERWIADAEVVVRHEFPDIDQRIASGVEPHPEPFLAANVAYVVTSMVTRALRNPDGVRQRQESTGPLAESETIAEARPGELYLKADERQMLTASGARRPRAFSINTAPNASALWPDVFDETVL